MLDQLAYLRSAQTGRASSWDETGRNSDAWWIEPGESAILADIKGPGRITHLWLTQANHYRECLLKITWDDADHPSVVCPLGDFFGLGHGIVNSYQSLLFSASTRSNNVFNTGCALNAYAQMPFRQRAVVELVNESNERHRQYFYVDYETGDVPSEAGYFHSEFRRENPFGGWGHEDPRQLAGGRHRQQGTDGLGQQLRHLGDPRPRPLHRLQHQRHQLPRHLVGRGRRHDLGRWLQVAPRTARHRQ